MNHPLEANIITRNDLKYFLHKISALETKDVVIQSIDEPDTNFEIIRNVQQ